jgi:hypothetical protein
VVLTFLHEESWRQSGVKKAALESNVESSLTLIWPPFTADFHSTWFWPPLHTGRDTRPEAGCAGWRTGACGPRRRPQATGGLGSEPGGCGCLWQVVLRVVLAASIATANGGLGHHWQVALGCVGALGIHMLWETLAREIYSVSPLCRYPLSLSGYTEIKPMRASHRCPLIMSAHRQ